MHGGAGRRGGMHVVTRSHRVTGVDAERHTLRLLHHVADQCKVPELVAKRCTGAHGVLETGDHLQSRQVAMQRVQARGDALQTIHLLARRLGHQIVRLLGGPRCTKVRTRMHHAQADVQRFTPLHFAPLQGHRLLACHGAWACQIRQIAVVTHHAVIVGLVPAGLAQGHEPLGQFRLAGRLGLPLSLVGGEHLHAVQAQRHRFAHRIGRSTRRTAMAADARHVRCWARSAHARRPRCARRCERRRSPPRRRQTACDRCGWRR